MPATSTGCNWNSNKLVAPPKEKRAHMMGEGLGANLGLDDPKYVAGKPLGWYEEQKRLQKAENSAESRKHKASRLMHKQLEWRYKTQTLPRKIESGEVLVGQRIFLCDWPKAQWEVISKNIPVPDGVDIAHTEYGNLLLVPVLEVDEAIERGIDPKVDKPLKDIEGRPCWVAASIKERIEQIFGRVRWTRPLTIKEAEQFGVKL